MEVMNTHAEQAVLGSVLIDGTLLFDLLLEEGHFYDARHRAIFRAMKQVAHGKHSVDMVTVTTALGSGLEQAGGTTYLLNLAESIASTAPIKEYEQLILDAYRLRQSRKDVLEFANDPSDEKLALLIEKLQHYQAGEETDEKTVNDYLVEITDEMCFPSEGPSGVMTNLRNFDDLTGGLQKGDLFIVAARPSVGKTAFALQIAAAHAHQGGYVHFFSLEMGIKSLLQRMISQEATINNRKWQHKCFSTDDYEHGLRAVGEISTWPLSMHDSARSANKIRVAVRKKVHEHPEESHVIIIDYLQLMESTRKHTRRDLEVGDITRELKQLAIELDVPIVLLSQLSRGVESRQDKRPMMSDLRDSGNIEQDADVIAFLYRDDYYAHQSNNTGQIEVIIAKQRNGPVGTVDLEFHKEYGRFAEIGGAVSV